VVWSKASVNHTSAILMLLLKLFAFRFKLRFFFEKFGQKKYLQKAEHYFLTFFTTKLELKVDLIEK